MLAAMMMPAASRGAAPNAPTPSLELHLPYPLTGPREIQASDRITRRYRAVASHASPPITDAMAATVEAAVLVALDMRLLRSRRDDAAALRRLATDTTGPHMLLAGDDLMRTTDRETDAADRPVPLPAMVDALATMPYVLLCGHGRCAGTAAAAERATPRTLAATSEWSASHLAARAYARQLGLAPLLVPYAGGNAVVGALVSGQADAAFVALPLALGYLRHDKLRALAVASEQRVAASPALPTLRERGVPVVVEGWFALFRSGRLDPESGNRIGAAVRAYRLEPTTRAEWTARGLLPVTVATETFRAAIERARTTGRTDTQ